MIASSYISGLGLTDNSKKKIFPGKEYDKYFPVATGATEIVNKNASVFETLDQIVKIEKTSTREVEKIAKVLHKESLPETLQSIFEFVYTHIAYEQDAAGHEQLRTPARLWKDKKGDCDCFSVTVGSILSVLGIQHYFKIIKRNYSPDYTHIYVIVPKSKTSDLKNRSEYWVIDPVLDRFNKEADKITQSYLKMGIQLEVLNGIGNYPLTRYIPPIRHNPDVIGHEFEGLEYVDDESLAAQVLLDGIKQHLINTAKHIEKGQKFPNKLLHAKRFKQGIDHAVKNWHNPTLRDQALDTLAGLEEQSAMYQPEIINGLGGLTGGLLDDPDVIGFLSDDLGQLGKGFFKKVGNAVKNATKKVASTAKKTIQKAGTVAKKVVKKAGEVAKKVGKFLVKINPLVIVIRTGVLAALAVNFAGISKKMMYGYLTQQQAVAKKIPLDQWQRSRGALDEATKLFVKTLQGSESMLKKAILAGKRGSILNGLGGVEQETILRGLLGLGVVAAAAAAPSVPFLVKLVTLVKKWFKGAKGFVDTVDNNSDSAKAAEEESQLDQFANQNPEATKQFDSGVPGDANAPFVQSNAPVYSNNNPFNPDGSTTVNPGANPGDQNPGNNSTVDPNAGNNTTSQPSGGGSTTAIVIGGLAIAALALSGGGSPRKRGLNGANKKKSGGKGKNRGKTGAKRKSHSHIYTAQL